MEFKRVEKDNVLLIDDVTSNLITLSEIIRNEGYIARPVKSVEYAMKAVDAELPSIILLDVTMPDMNGYDYCRILKKDIRTRNIPVIFISGLTGAKDRIRGFECGAVDFITKPFENMEVLMRINTHLKEYHMQKNLYIRNQKLNILVSSSSSSRPSVSILSHVSRSFARTGTFPRATITRTTSQPTASLSRWDFHLLPSTRRSSRTTL